MKHSILLALALVSTAWGQLNIQQIVRQSIENYGHDWREEMHWAWTRTDITASNDINETEVWEVAPIDGTPYERLIGRNGRSLTPEEQRREERKYEKALKERDHEALSQRAARLSKYESERAFIQDISEAYNFKLVGEEAVRGRPSLVVQMTTRPGFVPSAPHSSMLEHIEGKLWIDKEDVRWAKAEAHVIDTIGIGWILARIGAGARFGVQQTRVANGFWVPERLTISGLAQVMLVHGRLLNKELTYSGYHEAGSVSAVKR